MKAVKGIDFDEINFKALFRVFRYSSTKLRRYQIYLINIKSLLKVIFFKINLSKSSENKFAPPIINSFERDDYSKLIKKFLDAGPLCETTIIHSCSLKNNIKSFRLILGLSTGKGFYLQEILMLWFLLKNHEDFVEFIRKESVIVLFAEMQLYECYIALLARQLGCYTLGLQHGFYVDEKSKITLNSVNYKQISVDEILVWGAHSKRLIQKYNPKVKVTVIGRPSTHFLSSQALDLYRDEISGYLAILDGPEFNFSNAEVLRVTKELASRDKVGFFVKLHPGFYATSLPKELRSNLLPKDLTTLGTNPRIVGCRSSVLLELAAEGISCLVIDSSPFYEHIYDRGYGIQDHDVSELRDVSQYLSCVSPKSERLFSIVLRDRLQTTVKQESN